jgi:hypothetical protein
MAMTLGLKHLTVRGRHHAKLNGIKASTRQDDVLIQKTWGGALGMTMVVARGATPEAALAQNDRVFEALSRDAECGPCLFARGGLSVAGSAAGEFEALARILDDRSGAQKCGRRWKRSAGNWVFAPKRSRRSGRGWKANDRCSRWRCFAGRRWRMR